MFKKISDYIKTESELLKTNAVEVERANASFVMAIVMISFTCFTLLMVSSLFLEAIFDVRHSYMAMAVFIGACFLVIKFIPKMPKRLMIYLLFASIIAYSAYAGGFIYPDFLGVIILAFLVMFPQMVIDSTIKVTLAEVGFLVFYCMVMAFTKDADIVSDEIIDAVFFAVAGILLGNITRRTKLENIEMKRQSFIRETTDVLTGLQNRRSLFDYFIACESGKCSECISAIAIFDIDFFKKFNDTYGHLAGDDCLKKVGACMREYGDRHNLVFYRYGGEEFVAISHECDRQKADESLYGLCAAVNALKIKHEFTENGFASVSGGFVKLDITAESFKRTDKNSAAHKAEAERFQQFLALADNALYNAKLSGRNRVMTNE